jgi:hypothetical protein
MVPCRVEKSLRRGGKISSLWRESREIPLQVGLVRMDAKDFEGVVSPHYETDFVGRMSVVTSKTHLEEPWEVVLAQMVR